MLHKTRNFAVFVLLLFLLTACQGNPLPGGMEEETLLSHGRDVAAMLAGGQFEEVYALLRDDVAEGTSAEEIQAVVLQQTGGAGVYKQIDSTMVTGQSSQGESFGVAVIYCDYSKKDVLFRLAFDTNYELIGLDVKKQ